MMMRAVEAEPGFRRGGFFHVKLGELLRTCFLRFWCYDSSNTIAERRFIKACCLG